MKKYRSACAWAFVVAKPVGWKIAPVVLDVVYRHNKNAQGYKARDIQNAMASTKPLVDGMVDAGIVPNDSARWVSWGSFKLETREIDGPAGVFVLVRQNRESDVQR